MAQPKPETHSRELTHSGWEKKGGYASPKQPVPVASLPKVPTGPAPGAGKKQQ